MLKKPPGEASESDARPPWENAADCERGRCRCILNWQVLTIALNRTNLWHRKPRRHSTLINELPAGMRSLLLRRRGMTLGGSASHTLGWRVCRSIQVLKKSSWKRSSRRQLAAGAGKGSNI